MVTTSIESLINPAFYDPELDKGIYTGKDIHLDIKELFKSDSVSIMPLQYQEYDTIHFSTGARLFRVNYENNFFKVRLCANSEEAKGILTRLNFARTIGIPACAPLQIHGKYLLLDYEEGDVLPEKISKEEISIISNIHSKMNGVRFDYTTDTCIATKVHELIKISINNLKDKIDNQDLSLIEKKLRDIPKIISTFDHQDYGRHNIIKTKNNSLLIVDEEAFGILPLGYGVIRPVFDRQKYRLSENLSLNDYLKSYSEESQEYILSNLAFFRTLFVARNGYRRIKSGNYSAAKKLISEVRNYE
ncbi:TPA: hypothetical protein ENS27_19965 [bacterium]|nr:hypothetical protein [bacterium]